MIIDNDATGIEQARQQMAVARSYRPFCATWFAAKIDGEWMIFDTVGKLTKYIRKAQSIHPNILHGQKTDSYANRQFRKAFQEAR